MKQILTSLIFIIILSISTKAQNSTKPTYDVSFDMKTLVYHKYRFTENIRVKRIFSDSTINEYDKTVTYWFTAFVPGKKDENGFLTIEIATDSMKYQLNSNNKNISYFTQDYEAPIPVSDLDFMNSFLSNNQSFKFIYSPYGDVAEVTGDRLENERNIHSKIPDELKRDFLLSSISNETLVFKFDAAKGIYPTFEVINDTSWKSETSYVVNKIPMTGEFENTFVGYSNGEYHIKSIIESLELKSEINNYYFPDIDKHGTVTSAIATGEMKSDLYTGGTIKYVRSKIKSLMEGEINNLKYKQIVESNFTWDLLDRFSY
jgi:hypothetical protein